MKTRITACCLVAAALLGAPAAFAQTASLQSAWVSGLGSDTAGCGPVTTPCRTFQYAHDHVVIAGGQIRVKDPAGYGSSLTISKSISIINDGVGLAGMSAPSGSAITISAGPSDRVFIKGLSLDGAGTGSYGINLLAAGSLTVANCTMTGFGGANGAGVLIQPSSGSVTFDIFDSTAAGNAFVGIWIAPGYFSGKSNAVVKGTLTRIDASGNQYGVAADNAGDLNTITVLASQINSVGNTYGVYSNFSQVYLGASTVSGNAYGLVGTSGTSIFSYGNNAINGNTTDTSAVVVTKLGLQ